MAYLFGYYAKDPSYKDGVRAVVEIYMNPPKSGTRAQWYPRWTKTFL